MQLTPRDLQILTWLTRLHCATYQQLARLTATSVGALRRRLPLLEQHGHVVRVDSRRGDRPIALWFPTPQGAAATTTGINPLHPTMVGTERALLLGDIALPHHEHGAQLMAGVEITKTFSDAALKYGFRASLPLTGALPSPDLLIRGNDRLTALELRLGRAAADDWHQRLITYERLGVHEVLLHTDSSVLGACLASPGTYAAKILVTVRLHAGPMTLGD